MTIQLKEFLKKTEEEMDLLAIPVPMGVDTKGKLIVEDLSRLGHVLMAGSTGSGKSMFIHTWICTQLMRSSPNEVRLIIIDPKMVEHTEYNGIPHLLSPVVQKPDKGISALRWAQNEMNNRFKLFMEVGVRNISAYNDMSGFQALPYILIFIDEFSDLMAFDSEQTEKVICSLASMSRATGIHMVISTSRPSIDVYTPQIRDAISTRIAFNLSSAVDSRFIINEPGAETLLGCGDMLFLASKSTLPVRIQGAYISDNYIKDIVLQQKKKIADRIHVLRNIQPKEASMNDKDSQLKKKVEDIEKRVRNIEEHVFPPVGKQDGADMLLSEAIALTKPYNMISASLLQRRLSIGYARAARILDQLEELGLVGPGEGSKPRKVIVKKQIQKHEKE